MKKMILGLVAATMMLSGQAFAGAEGEASIQARLLEQVLNSIDKPPAVDFNLNDMSISKGGKEDSKTKVQIDLDLNGYVEFGGDWGVELVSASASESADEQMKKLFPKLKADAKGLIVAVEGKMNDKEAFINAKLFSGYDKKTKKWTARPLIVKVTNQLNKSLLTIRIHALYAERKANPQNPENFDVAGTCESDKMLYDYMTGQTKMVKVDCRFSGIMTKNDGYKISFRYASK